jgi:tRNA-Thr(GGU) m(6)t(6)A37 methyltransferase TsaA
MKPIGFFISDKVNRYEAPHQPGFDASDEVGIIRLEKGHNFEQALTGLKDFDRIWVIFQFHLNNEWKPMVQPPRAEQKWGVFATRSPHRPNNIGLSCVEVLSIEGLDIKIKNHDLLHETPILDIKPYIPYADSFPESRAGWVEALRVKPTYKIEISPPAQESLEILKHYGVKQVDAFLRQQLCFQPTDTKQKRIHNVTGDFWEIAYRTWRIGFELFEREKKILILGIESGYSESELDAKEDPYGDKQIHREYLKLKKD